MTATFPDRHYFLNTPENVKACLQQFPKTRAYMEAGGVISQDWFDERASNSAFRCCDGELSCSGEVTCQRMGLTEYKFPPASPAFPEKHWFLNTAENRKAFVQQFPNEKWCDNEAATEESLAKYDGKYVEKQPDVGLVYGIEQKDTSKGFTEYKFTPAPAVPCEARTTAPLLPQFPTGFYFLNTPKNLEAFEREFPGQKWNHTAEDSAVSIMRNLEGVYAFRHHAFGNGQGFTSSCKDAGSAARYYFPHEQRDTVSPLVELAKKCVGKGLSSQEYDTLSAALKGAGYTHLARAVLGGIHWADEIANGKSLAELEKTTSGPGWSWNNKPVVATSRTLGVGEYITVAQGRLADACREFSNVGEYCNDIIHHKASKGTIAIACMRSGRLSWEDRALDIFRESHACKEVRWDGSAKEEKDAVDVVAEASSFVASPVPPKPAEESVFVPTPLAIVTNEALAKRFKQYAKAWQHPKPSRAKRILAYCLSPAKVWAQNITFLCAVGGIGYGGWKAYEWAKENAPTIKWEPKQEVGK